MTNNTIKENLLDELKLRIDFTVQGIGVNPDNFSALGITSGSDTSGYFGANVERLIPADIDWSTSLNLIDDDISITDNPYSPYVLEPEDGKSVLNLYKFGRKEKRIAEFEFFKRLPPPLSGKLTKDGVPFQHIANIGDNGRVHVSYSNECVLQEKGQTCKFCNYKARKSIIKTPQQVGEVYAAAVESGIGKHFIITGGFVPERRELEYYLDVAEEIRNRTGFKRFSGTAIAGAPLDFDVIDKYHEAGFSHIKMNVEIWQKDIWKAICPGKHDACGGWENWVKALEYGANIFGKGHVGANIVGGIEPKESILEGVEYLASKGVIGTVTIWRPSKGSDLEGHRTPNVLWHFELAKKIAAIYQRYGFTVEQVCSIGPGLHPADIVFMIENGFIEDGHLKKWIYSGDKNLF